MILTHIYVAGHRNPDCDSVVSSIAYAEIKNLLGESAGSGGRYLFVPVRIGPLNKETAYALERFGFGAPMLMQNAYPQVKDASLDPVVKVRREDSFFQAWQYMREAEAKCALVTDENGKLLGIVTLDDIGRRVLSFYCDGVGPSDCGRKDKVSVLTSGVGEFIQNQDIKAFSLDDPISEVQEVMKVFDYKQFPVVNEHDQPQGILRRKHILERPAKTFILVDHNEESQAIEGIEEARVLEIIDHHRINSIETDEPISFINYPYGSTSTIIGQVAQDKGLTLRPELAGILLAGILSDTLAFRSPTSTEHDIAQAKSLAAQAGVDLEDLHEEMLKVGSNLEGMNPRDILRSDFKEFHIEGLKLGIGQVMVYGRVPHDVTSKLQEEMFQLAQDGRYDLLLMMLTDVQANGSMMLWYAQDPFLVYEAFGVENQTEFFLDGVVSRKKQVLPRIIAAIRRKY